MANVNKPGAARPAGLAAKTPKLAPAAVLGTKPFVAAAPAAKPVKPPFAAPTPASAAAVIVANPATPAKATPVAKPVASKPTPVAAKPVVAAPAPVAAPAKPVVAAPSPVVAAAPIAPSIVTAPVPAPEPAPAAEPVIMRTPPVQTTKEAPMNETNTQNGAAEAMKAGAQNAYTNGKAAFEQVTTKSKETIEQGMKSLDEMGTMAKGNVEALLASTKAATAGLEAIAHQVADFSRKSFEETTAAARAMTTVKSPNELMQLQSDFAKTQFDAAVAELSKLSETMVKLAGEVFEPVQNRVALATDKIKSAVGSGFKA